MENRVLVLDASMTPVRVVEARRGIGYLISGKGYSILDTEVEINAGSIQFEPSIVVLAKSVSHLKYRKSKPLKWSKKGVLKRDGHICTYCLGTATTVDHIKPKKLGGENSWKNTIAACKSCNGRKGCKTLKNSGLTMHFEPYVPTHLREKLTLNERQKTFLLENKMDHILDGV